MTAPRNRVRLAAGVLLVTAVTAACGLKPEANDSLKAPNGGVVPGAVAGGVPGSTGATGGAAAGAPGAGPGSTVAGGPAGTVPGTTAGSGGGGTTTRSGGSTHGGSSGGGGGSGGPAACGVPSGGDTTGVTSSSINIGLHAPLTGTGTPFPNSSFQKGAGVFWQQPGHEVCGRKVNVEFKDDTYTPSGARSVCSQMASRDFLVV